MLIAAYIVLALSFGIGNMLMYYRCVSAAPIRLNHGLGASLITTVIQTALFMAGMTIGDLVRFELTDIPNAMSKTNAMVMFGMVLIVALRQLAPYLRRNREQAVFDLRSWKTTLAMSIATGVNLFLTGIGVGFVASPSTDIHKALWPMVIILLLLSYWGVMLGRQKVKIRPRRWALLEALLIIGVGVAALINS